MSSIIGRVYALAATLAAPGLRVWLWWRQRKGKELAGHLSERWGGDESLRPRGRLLWVHAASVGEMTSILPVVQAMGEDIVVLFTTSTVTSANLLETRLSELRLRGRVMHRFIPLDVPRWVRRFLNLWQPEAAVFVESEIWPNILNACWKRSIPTVILNGRMSEKSLLNWQRAPGFAREVMGHFTLIRARSEEDAERFRALGGEQVTAPGDLKFSAPPLPVKPEDLQALREWVGDRPVWLAASTHPGEEELIVQAHAILAQRYPGLLTIVVPRHPERAAALVDELEAMRLDLGAASKGEFWLVDSLGQLGLLYSLCKIVFVGGSLVAPGGGHNPLEAARFGCALAVGPHTGNFNQAVGKLVAARALVRVISASALASWVSAMLASPERCAIAGEAAREVASQSGSLIDETVTLLRELASLRSGGEALA